MLNTLNALLDLLPMASVMWLVYLCVWAGERLRLTGRNCVTWMLVYYLPILLLLGAGMMLTVGMVK